MKRLSELSDIEKANYLHELLPDQIRPFLVFVEETTKKILNDPAELFQELDTNYPKGKWMEVVELLNEVIDAKYNDLVNDSTTFSQHLFKGYIGVFVMQCLQEYIIVCEDEKFCKAIELFFD